jgi:glycosyltransferase involved in cell wall biosynthesis
MPSQNLFGLKHAGPLPESPGSVSLCLIVKNEADKLAPCLGSVAGLVQEMIVIDTGSTDGTQDVARRHGARVFDFAWIDDFSAARNESIRHATCPWVLWLDADEWLDDDNRARLGALVASLSNENAAYVMKQLSIPTQGGGGRMAVDQVRLFRNDPAIRWCYRVHEQILLALRAAEHDVRSTDIAIAHAGYHDAAERRRKLDRNVRLMELEKRERPDDPITLFNLGWAYQQQGKVAESLPLLRRSLVAWW